MARLIDPVDVLVGQRVRAFRLSRGMSQSALGKKIGVSFQQLQKYERGTNRLGSSRLKKVATILGVTVAALFGEDGDHRDETVDRMATEVASQRWAARLLRAFQAIKNVEQRRALVELAESMARYTQRPRQSGAPATPI